MYFLVHLLFLLTSAGLKGGVYCHWVSLFQTKKLKCVKEPPDDPGGGRIDIQALAPPRLPTALLSSVFPEGPVIHTDQTIMVL